MLEAAKYDSSLDVTAMESPRFTGRCVAAQAGDENLIDKTGRILITAELAEHYGFTDIDGKQPQSLRGLLW